MKTPIPVITIDGPSGSGKGTIGLMLSKALDWHFLDSGALYRILAHIALQQQIDLKNEEKLANLARSLPVSFTANNGDNMEILWSHQGQSQNISQQIRTETCGNAASQIAVFPSVRDALLERQRAFCQAPGLVADGRDMGTVVFPSALVKIFLEASPLERAKRRYLQLKEKGENVNLQTLLEEIEARDVRDKSRVIAPLKPAMDAVVIDTTGIGVEAVFEQVLKIVKQRIEK